jgi:hypothetical protein
MAMIVANHGLDDCHLPHHWFSKADRALLRCVWAMQDKEWLDLPGPPEAWPDNPEYYTKYGFDVQYDLKDAHRQAVESLSFEEPPDGWMAACLHEDNRDELVWNTSF